MNTVLLEARGIGKRFGGVHARLLDALQFSTLGSHWLHRFSSMGTRITMAMRTSTILARLAVGSGRRDVCVLPTVVAVPDGPAATEPSA